MAKKQSNIELHYIKIRDVKDPERAHSTDAGIDFRIPNDYPITNIQPQQRVLIPSGIKVLLPENFALIFFNKSGIAAKLGLDCGSCVVDYGYKGEVHLSVINTSNATVQIEPGMKILQGILLPMTYAKLVCHDTEKDLYDKHESDRGETGFGDSGK
jgi:dUTP pyrophosphatase